MTGTILEFKKREADIVEMLEEKLGHRKFIIMAFDKLEASETTSVYVGEGFDYKDKLFAVDTLGRVLLDGEE